ncbi:MAG: mechanosensitive ion channel [Spirochaetes bacterium]|nr:mechanosensitive ion channel [Spirochaetota bacterium]
MPEVIRLFFQHEIIKVGTYSISVLNTVLMVPIVAVDVFIVRMFTRFIRKRDLYKKKFVRNLGRVFKGIVHLLAFVAVMRVFGVRLANIFDFIAAVLSFKLFTIAGTDISLLTIIVMVIVVFVAAKIAKVVRNYFSSRVFARFNIEEGLRFSLAKLIGYLIIIIGVIIALQGFGIKLTALTVFAGVLGVGIGFGMQSITANIVSGFVILFERPIKEGDMVRLHDTIGEVTKINLRATVIKTILNEHLIVPNSEFINSTVENMSYGDIRVRIKVNVGVAYGTDPGLVKDALLEAAGKTENVMKSPPPSVLFREFGNSSLNFELLVWIDHPRKRFDTESDLHFEIVNQFRRHGITIPFPQHDVYIKKLPKDGEG